MAGWTVMLRGIRHRAGRSLLVLLLATVATAATVLAPGYSRAAQQSVLADALAEAPADATGMEIRSAGSATVAPAVESVDEAKLTVGTALNRRPGLRDHFDRPIGGAEIDAVAHAINVHGKDVKAHAEVAYRDSVCRHVTITDGQCPTQPGEVLVSDRSAHDLGLAVGVLIDLRADSTAKSTMAPRQVKIVGRYTPKDAAEAYWGRGGYFSAGLIDENSQLPRMDAIFVGDEQDLAVHGAPLTVHLDYRLRPATVQLDDLPALRAGLNAFGLDMSGAQLELNTSLGSILEDAGADTGALGRAVPIVAVPLVMLCWFVLFLLVAALTEERAAEIALAKLRGYPLRRAARFGRAEALLLIVVATPLGTAGGMGLVEMIARTQLHPGVHAELRWPVFAAAALALIAAVGAAMLAGRRTLSRPVLALLRRVPERSRWRAGVIEGVIVALAIASLAAAASDRSAPLALLAAPLLALVAGVVASRLLGLWSRLRVRSHARRGRVSGLLAHAQMSRRPLAHQVIAVVTVAVALLSFAATAWDVATQARLDQADDVVGAQRVVMVGAANPDALVAAVDKADPDGHLMAVVRATQHYGSGSVELLGVQSDRLSDVAVWRHYDHTTVDELAGKLHPEITPPIILDGFMQLDVTASGLVGAPRLVALVAAAGGPTRTLDLGQLVSGDHHYRAPLTGCDTGCRLLGLGLARASIGTDRVAGTLRFASLSSQIGAVNAHFGDADRWRVNPVRAPRAKVSVTAGSALTVRIDSTDPGDVILDYVDTPESLPVIVAGTTPTDDPGATTFTFPAFAERAQPFTVVAQTNSVPRGGREALLFDLDYAVRQAQHSSSLADNTRLRYEVWAGPQAPANLTSRLSAAGLQILGQDSVRSYLAQLSRGAPALGLRLYLLAGAAAVLLAVGAVLLTAYIGADTRRYGFAALRVAGVRPKTLRRSILREYLTLLGLPLLVGLAAGVAGAMVMLPGIPLVTVGTTTNEVSYRPDLGVLPLAVAVTIAGLILAVFAVLRTVRRATPERLREGAR